MGTQVSLQDVEVTITLASMAREVDRRTKAPASSLGMLCGALVAVCWSRLPVFVGSQSKTIVPAPQLGCQVTMMRRKAAEGDMLPSIEVDEGKPGDAEVVACVAVNDPFVMAAWGKQKGAADKVRMLADSKCELTKALDMELDATAKLGTVRSKRYAMLVEDGKIVKLGMDDDSFAPTMLEALK